MLMLSRAPGQSFHIILDGKTVATVWINEVKGKFVRFGVEADINVRIERDDVATRPGDTK